MANRDAPRGFRPITPDAPVHEYTLTAGQTIYKGDPVILTSGGTVSISAAGQTTTHIGVAAEYKDDSASASGKKIMVYDDPETEFVVQTTDSISTSISNVFNTADHITMAAGNTTTKQSIMELDTPGTSSKPWIILRLYDAPDNAWGEFSDVVVKYNQHVRIAAYAGL